VRVLRRFIIFLACAPAAWSQWPTTPGLTNKPVPYSSTITVPEANVPTVNVPQVTTIEIPVAGAPLPPIQRSTPAPTISPFKPSAAIPNPTTSDIARRNVQFTAPTQQFTAPTVTQKALPPNPSTKTTPTAAPSPAAKPLPPIYSPVPFNTPEADAILAAMQIFPADNLWHADISQWPVYPKSAQIIGAVGSGRPLEANQDMGFIIVPKDAPHTGVKLAYLGESDLGPYPLPSHVPIEGWPVAYKRSKRLRSLTLDDVQRDALNLGGDRHAIVVDPYNQKLYEFYAMRKTTQGWEAAQASIFDLSSNKLRPDGWTSSDAAGLPIFPAVVRYDELMRGEIDHALRVTVPQSRRAYVTPATHFASELTDENLPRMGERFRLRQNYYIENFSPMVQTILKALKKYGMFVADNGAIFAISVAPDERIPLVLDELNRLTVADFEVVTAPH